MSNHIERLPICSLTVRGECLVEADVEERRRILSQALQLNNRNLAVKTVELSRVIKGSACEGCQYVKELAKGDSELEKILNQKEST